MAKTYRSKDKASIHELAESLHSVGAIDRKTMRDYDALCLAPVPSVSPEDIRALRDREMASQPIFARYLNVSPGLISQWERGEKRPGGASLKLLSLVKEKGLDVLV